MSRIFLFTRLKITSGEGVKYYFDYDFTYTGLIHMDSKIDVNLIPVSILDKQSHLRPYY